MSDYQKIDEPPKHHSTLSDSLPPAALATLTESERWLYNALSVMQQDMDWVKRTAMDAYNMAVDHKLEKDAAKKDEAKSKRWVLRTLFAAACGGAAEAIAAHYFWK